MTNEIVIDAKKRLWPNAIQQFKENQSPDTNVVMYIEPQSVMFEKPLKSLREFFEDETIEEIIADNDCVISFITDYKILQIHADDYRWWIAVVKNKKYRRLERLFGDVEEKVKEKLEKVKVQKQSIKCACGYRDAGCISEIQTFEGTEKETLNFINKMSQLYLIRGMFKREVVFCVNFDDGIELANASNWSTMTELFEKGVFVE